MKIEQRTFSSDRWRAALDAAPALDAAQLVLVFGDRELLVRGECLTPLRARYPTASIVACSSGGIIARDRVEEHGAVATAIRFDRSTVQAVEAELPTASQSEEVGGALAERLDVPGLRHVLVFAEGLHVNGSALARGLASRLPATVSVTGGLAADGDRFVRTAVGLDRAPAPGRVVAVGLTGDALEIGVGSFGGWQPFGPDRVITRSDGNVLYELDGRKALALYRELLGPLGYALPSSGLMFPLNVRVTPGSNGVVRTILGVDEAAGSVTFAGDMPQGATARLLRTTLDELIAAAGVAAGQSRVPLQGTGPGAEPEAGLALAVSCIGRRLLLQQRVGEEIAGVRAVMGQGVELTGFYAYGELAPSTAHTPCELHNQTMTITTLRER